MRRARWRRKRMVKHTIRAIVLIAIGLGAFVMLPPSASRLPRRSVQHDLPFRTGGAGRMESGFPEIWVLVPWESSVRRPGLAIYVRRDDGYREEPSSRAFPGWRAEEIFRALTEAPMSEGAWRALERTALAMGAREGTKPEDDPLMRSHSAQVRAEGRREGRAEGHREGVAQGHMNAVVQVLEE